MPIHDERLCASGLPFLYNGWTRGAATRERRLYSYSYAVGAARRERATLGAALDSVERRPLSEESVHMPAGMIRHLWRALRHALGKILAWAAVAFLATALLTEVVAMVVAGPNALVTLTPHLVALALALAVGYAVGFTTLIVETVTLLEHGALDLERAGAAGVERLERIKQPL